MLSKEECQGTQLCALVQVVDSMGMSSTALTGSRLQGQECKRVTAARDLRYTSVWLALSSLTSTAHSLFLHIDNTFFLRKASMIHIELLFRNAPVISS